MEGEHLDARLGGIEQAFLLVGTGHLALQAAGAFERIDVQGSLHGNLLRSGRCDAAAAFVVIVEPLNM
jgi:hypothetical protein